MRGGHLLHLRKRIILAYRSIVVAPDDRGDMRPCPIDREVRIGAVSDQVAQAQDLIVAALRVAEHGLKRLPVSMDVAEDQVGHNLRYRPARDLLDSTAGSVWSQSIPLTATVSSNMSSPDPPR